jgi:hypothetical protein
MALRVISRKTTMQEHGNGGGTTKAAQVKNAQPELPALLLPHPRPPRIDDPDRGKAHVVEPLNRLPQSEEARNRPDRDDGNPHAGGESA